MSNITKETQNKNRLGRGLGSLLSGANQSTQNLNSAADKQPLLEQLESKKIESKPTGPIQPIEVQSNLERTEPNAEAKVWSVAITKLKPSKFQPRHHFKKEALEELAQSIKINGILQPIVARRIDGNSLEIIAGERRWRAAQLAGLHEVPVILKTLKNEEVLQLAIIENVQREDLNPIDEAEAYQRLAQEFSLTQSEIADRVGKDRATVANTMRLLNLTMDVRDMLGAGEISAGHAKVLLSVDGQVEQKNMAKRIINQGLSVRALEKLIKSTKLETADEKVLNSRTDANQNLISGLEDELQKLMGRKTTIDYKRGKGKISISFYSAEEFNELVEKLRNSCQI